MLVLGRKPDQVGAMGGLACGIMSAENAARGPQQLCRIVRLNSDYSTTAALSSAQVQECKVLVSHPATPTRPRRLPPTNPLQWVLPSVAPNSFGAVWGHLTYTFRTL